MAYLAVNVQLKTSAITTLLNPEDWIRGLAWHFAASMIAAT
jgi:hypothetical protein